MEVVAIQGGRGERGERKEGIIRGQNSVLDRGGGGEMGYKWRDRYKGKVVWDEES